MIKQNLLYLRTKNGYSQQQIADVIKVSIALYQAYERGRCNVPTPAIFLLCDFYAVDVYAFVNKDLATFKEEMNDPAKDMYRRFKRQPVPVKNAIKELLGINN